MPRDGDIGRTALEFSYMWGMDQIKRCLEAHGFVHLTPKSCARCLVNTYKKFNGDDWEKFSTVKSFQLQTASAAAMACIEMPLTLNLRILAA